MTLTPESASLLLVAFLMLIAAINLVCEVVAWVRGRLDPEPPEILTDISVVYLYGPNDDFDVEWWPYGMLLRDGPAS